MGQIRLRINLLYKDGTDHEIILVIPPEVAAEIERKGLMAAKIYVDSYIQVSVADTAIFDKFKKG